MQHIIVYDLATLAIATLFYTWRAINLRRLNRENLHDRVAYMLWVAASRD